MQKRRVRHVKRELHWDPYLAVMGTEGRDGRQGREEENPGAKKEIGIHKPRPCQKNREKWWSLRLTPDFPFGYPIDSSSWLGRSAQPGSKKQKSGQEKSKNDGITRGAVFN